MADINGGYKAGDLEVSILGIATDVNKSISGVIASLDKLQRALQVFATINTSNIGANLAKAFQGIGTALQSIDDASIGRLKSLGTAVSPIARFLSVMKSLDSGEIVAKFDELFQGITQTTATAVGSAENISSIAKALSSLTRVANKIGGVDFKSVKAQFEQLTEAIRPFLAEIKQAENGLISFEQVIKRLGISGKGKGKGKTKLDGAFGFLNIAKWTSVFYLGRRLGNVVQSIVQSGADYTETLNLWEVAMGNNLSTATQFVNKMNEAYGISEKTLMNAQAIFKNMLGSLGQISDTMAYELSEGITQMALDYASLYNVNFEKAFEKFQAALAGQVRPIRSVSGYDITENTLYQLYQTLGGEKSVRNLSRTEKQLLSILAIFNQMTASGAVGDLERTMESFANQSRVLREEWQRVTTYAGLLIVQFIETKKWLLTINASMIALGDILYAAASATGAIKSYGDPFASVSAGAENASDEIDKMNGKLLDFDKFRALSSQEDESIGIEQTLLNAVSQYSTILADASNSAKDMAENFKKASGFFTEDGMFNIDKWNELIDRVETLAISIGVLAGVNGIVKLVTSFDSAKVALTSLNGTLITVSSGALFAFIKACADGDTEVAALSASILGLNGIIALIANKEKLGAFGKALTSAFKNPLPFVEQLKSGVGFLALGLSMLAIGVITFVSSWGDMSGVQRATTIITSLTLALVALVVALNMTKGNWVKALGVAGAVGGAVLTVSSLITQANKQKIYDAEVGASNIDSGTVFRAGEHGKTETVFTAANGKTNVANVQQMRSAFYQALMDYSKSNQGQNQPIKVSIDGREVFEVTTAQANKQGLSWSRV